MQPTRLTNAALQPLSVQCPRKNDEFTLRSRRTLTHSHADRVSFAPPFSQVVPHHERVMLPVGGGRTKLSPLMWTRRRPPSFLFLSPVYRVVLGRRFILYTYKQGSFAVGGFGGIIWLCRGQEGGWVMGGYGRTGGGGRHPRVGGYGAAPPDHAPATRGPLVLLPFSARGKQEQCSTGGAVPPKVPPPPCRTVLAPITACHECVVWPRSPT